MVLARCAAALIALAAAGLRAQPAPTQQKKVEPCSLSGAVVDSRTGEPVAGARITLETLGQDPAPHASGVTDAKGVFGIAGASPGVYKLKAERNGYLKSYYGARRPGAAGTRLTLEPGCELKGLPMRLEPFAVVAGAVRDAGGEPLFDARVFLLRLRYAENGEKQYETVVSANTDDLGHYRIAGLAPGRYYVRARAQEWPPKSPQVQAPGATRLEVSVPAFYPAAATVSAAAPIEVNAGDRITGIDVTLPSSRLFSVSGQVVSAGGELEKQIVLFSEDSTASSLVTELARNGRFVIPYVTPGSYQLRATAGGRDTGLIPVKVSGADVEDLRVVIQRTVMVKGRLTIEAQQKLLPDIVSLEFYNPASRLYSYVRIGSESGALSGEIIRGRNELRVTFPRGAATGMYVKSARYGQTDVLTEGFTVLESGSELFELTISDGAGKAEGSVLDKDEQPAAGATVLLAPVNAARTDLYQNVTADQRGHYAFDRVPPGEYKLYAWDDVEAYIWFAPDFLKSHEAKATALSVKERAAPAITLHLIEPAAR
jgi:hypothetical protein